MARKHERGRGRTRRDGPHRRPAPKLAAPPEPPTAGEMHLLLALWTGDTLHLAADGTLAARPAGRAEAVEASVELLDALEFRRKWVTGVAAEGERVHLTDAGKLELADWLGHHCPDEHGVKNPFGEILIFPRTRVLT